MASRAVTLSITQVATGVLLWAVIEAILPDPVEDASLTSTTFETAVQVGLNGVALATFAGLVRGEGVDPTYGIPFAYAMTTSQRKLRQRLEVLSSYVTGRVAAVTLQMAAPVLAA